jgi:hypothetical protein
MQKLKVCFGILFLVGYFALGGGTAPLQAQSDGFIYFPNAAVNSRIGRANLNDPTDVQPSFITWPYEDNNNPLGIAADEKYLYWANSIGEMNNPSTIARANLDGKEINWGFMPVHAYAITVDEKYIYWTNPWIDTIGRANLDGTGINEQLIECPAAWGLFGVAVSGKYVYWVERDRNRIGRAELDENDNVRPGTVNRDWITQFARGPEGVVVTKNHVYWTNGFGGYPGPNWEEYRNTIGRADIDGTNCEIWIAVRYEEIRESHLIGIASKGDFIYWADYYCIIGRSNLDKSVYQPIWSRAPAIGLLYIALDKNLYAFEGFFSPIDNVPTVNKANAGQAIPVKWRLTDKNGMPVSDPASFKGITSTRVGCASLAEFPINYVDEPATGSSGLQYLGDGWWQFNWKTPKTYSGQCRTMKLTLNDGSVHTANFSFK